MHGLREIDHWFVDCVLPHERRYLALARRFCRSADEAADLVQETYARVMTSEGWRFIDEPRAYVLTMVRNLGIQKLRRARIVSIESLSEVEAARQVSEAPDPFEETSGRQRLRLALDSLKALPPTCREVVELRRLHDLSARDIARRLGLSLSTVEKRLARGMALMALAMGRADRIGETETETETEAEADTAPELRPASGSSTARRKF